MDTTLSPTQALDLLRRNPCDVTPAIKALRDTADLNDPALPLLYARIAAALPSVQELEDILGDRAHIMANFYPTPKEATPSTEDTIDTFLSTFGAADARECEVLSKVIFNPTPDYAAVLAAEERNSIPAQPQAEESEQDKLINSFILKNHAPTTAPPQQPELKPADKSEKLTNRPQPAPEAPRPAPESTLTVSFVKMLIKNGNYPKALEIISEINLNNPKKSIYFAD